MVWNRPNDVEYPKEWVSFVHKKTNRKFIIKDLSEEYYDIVLGYMTNMFLKESAICKPLNILDDPVACSQMQARWLQIMKEKLAIICVTDEELPRVAGVHMTLIRDKQSSNNNKTTDPNNKFSKFYKVVQDLKNEGQLFEKFGVDQYLGSLGLFVLPEFRGMGIATEMLKARIHMCKTFNFRGTATVFSTAGAQAAALTAGYSVLARRSRDDLSGMLDLDHSLVVMGMVIES